MVYDSAGQMNEGHEHREIRPCWVVARPEYRAYLREVTDWLRLITLLELMTVRVLESQTSVETRYFIISWRASARVFLRRIREHWHIENRLHWVLDVTLREDESCVCKDQVPQNLATLRHIALNLPKQERFVKVGVAAKRKMAGGDNAYLLKVFCL